MPLLATRPPTSARRPGAPARRVLTAALGLALAAGPGAAVAGSAPDRARTTPAAVALADGAGPAAGRPATTGRSSTQAVRVGRKKRRVVFVGNNWEGTADLLRPGSFKRIARIDVVPDREERMSEILSNPVRLAFYAAIQQFIGEGNDQLVDDMYSSNDGRLLVVSRPSFADVVALDLRTREIVWRFAVDGYRSDHMALSPDGRTVVVSASTGNVVHALDVRTGEEVGRFESGGSPHESVYIDGGRRILHASIGMVYSPFDHPSLDPTKDERVLQVVDARTFEIERRYDLRAALDAAGLEDTSTAVRPLTLSPDEQQVYFQLSFMHGFVQMDRRSGEITRVKRLPDLVPETPRELYLLDSAHHGIAMDPTGRRICVAGTMSDYVTVVDARSFKRTPLLVREDGKPYWVTPSHDGKHCYISWSGTDEVSKVSYRTGEIVRTTSVGDHPQRVRNGVVRKSHLR
ncbi:PQQ-binding-like beta-propeller repeat protein [Nocardioides cremeus]|jgi:DNA-binding beta-propeller fold protein YncE|uniref:PQQ-binding-like beta-propeller repeat protein n=1 Tax=Nocardioides cremeus TaxID=3058044 RepID=A0ABT8TMW4_9ACTN|nr:PQQ-binding-like beta-propeller repeat protein [Nocardioides cremeus]MDO3395304.1 PQQ-binding-like beta-propeller repeat protein [Nocardioides cremeus]